MKGNQNNLTLENIGKLIKRELARNNLAIFDEIEKVGQVVQAVDLKAGGLKEEMGNLKEEMNERFNFVDNQLQKVIGVADEIAEQKVEKLRHALGHAVKI